MMVQIFQVTKSLAVVDQEARWTAGSLAAAGTGVLVSVRTKKNGRN
jgi:hypothetical protein